MAAQVKSATAGRSLLSYRQWVTLLRLGFAVLVFGLWALTSRLLDAEFWIGEPVGVLMVLWGWIVSGEIFKHVSITFQEMIAGFVLGSASGALVGFILGTKLSWYRVAQPIIDSLYTMPKLAIGPLLIMWFGIGIGPKIGLIVLMVFFLVFMSTFTGVRDVDPELLSVARLMGASQMDLYRMIILPSALTSILVGLKISVPYALLGAIIGELLVGNQGLGYLLNYASAKYDTNSLFAALIVTAIVSMAVNGALGLFEKSALSWKPSNRRVH
jgi:NitT/TauT family transport system permease protein